MAKTNLFKYMIPATSEGINQGFGIAEKQQAKQQQNQELRDRYAYEKDLQLQTHDLENQEKNTDFQNKYKNLSKILGVNNVEPTSQPSGVPQSKSNLSTPQTSLTPERQQKVQDLFLRNMTLGVPVGETSKQIEDILNPKPHTIIQKGHSTISVYPDGTQQVQNYEGINPAYKPDYKESAIDANGTIDRKTGKHRIEYGGYDPELGQWETGKDGKPIVKRVQEIAIKTKGTNGESIYSPEYQKIMDKDFVNVLDSDVSLKSLYQSGQIVYKSDGKTPKKDKFGNIMKSKEVTDKKGNKQTVNSDDYINQLQGDKQTAINKILSSTTNKFSKYYSDLQAQEKSSKRPYSAETFWKMIQSDYVKKIISERDLQAAANLARAKYGVVDPFRQFGIIDDIQSMDQMKKKLKDDTEDSLDNE